MAKEKYSGVGPLRAGAARRVINPPLGVRRPGIRLFADPIRAIESDLTATALILTNGPTKLLIIACDLLFIPLRVTTEIRQKIGDAIGTPSSHVMINCSHTHSGPAFPDWIEDDPEQMELQGAYQVQLIDWLIELSMDAAADLRPARMASGWGESRIGVYRRETDQEGNYVLGEVPDAAIDPAVGVLRVDDLNGVPIAILFSYGCHPVTMGPLGMVASSDFPGPARELIEYALGGVAIFLQACGGNINPKHGIGYELDCRDTKNRTGLELGGEVVRVGAGLRTHVHYGPRRTMDSIEKIKFRAWETVKNNSNTILTAVDEEVPIKFMDLPSLEEAQKIKQEYDQKLQQVLSPSPNPWDLSVARRFSDWSSHLVEAVRAGNPPINAWIQAFRIDDAILAGISAETFFETGLAIKQRSPFTHTQVLGYTNACIGYIPRAEDYPPGGWKLTERYAVPDLFFQQYSLPVAFRPETEQQVVDRVVNLIENLADKKGL